MAQAQDKDSVVTQFSLIEHQHSLHIHQHDCIAGQTYTRKTLALGLASNSTCTVFRVALQRDHHWSACQGMAPVQPSTSGTYHHYVNTSKLLLWTHWALACQVRLSSASCVTTKMLHLCIAMWQFD